MSTPCTKNNGENYSLKHNIVTLTFLKNLRKIKLLMEYFDVKKFQFRLNLNSFLIKKECFF